MESHILTLLNTSGEIADSESIVEASKQSSETVDAALKSLLVDEYVVLEVIEVRGLKLSSEGAEYVQKGTPEYQYAMAAPFGQEVSKAQVEEKVGKEIAKIGFAKAMQKKWVQLSGAQKENVKRVVNDSDLNDEDKTLLLTIQNIPDPEKHDKKVIDNLKKRQLVNVVSKKSYRVTKGPNYLPVR